MAKSAAERQRAYRARRPFAGQDGNGERRLNIYISTAAALALGRLAQCRDLSKRQMLEKLIIEADQAVIASLDEGELENYLAVTA